MGSYGFNALGCSLTFVFIAVMGYRNLLRYSLRKGFFCQQSTTYYVPMDHVMGYHVAWVDSLNSVFPLKHSTAISFLMYISAGLLRFYYRFLANGFIAICYILFTGNPFVSSLLCLICHVMGYHVTCFPLFVIFHKTITLFLLLVYFPSFIYISLSI